MGLEAGTEVSLTSEDGELVLRPSVPNRLRLADLLAGVTPENIHESVETGNAVGAEAFLCRPTCLIVVIWCGWSSHQKPEVNSVEEDQHLFYLQRPTTEKLEWLCSVL